MRSSCHMETAASPIVVHMVLYVPQFTELPSNVLSVEPHSGKPLLNGLYRDGFRGVGILDQTSFGSIRELRCDNNAGAKDPAPAAETPEFCSTAPFR